MEHSQVSEKFFFNYEFDQLLSSTLSHDVEHVFEDKYGKWQGKVEPEFYDSGFVTENKRFSYDGGIYVDPEIVKVENDCLKRTTTSPCYEKEPTAALENKFQTCQSPDAHTRTRLQSEIETYKLSPVSMGSLKKQYRADRTVLSENQFIVLEREFDKCPTPDYETRCELASMLNLTSMQVYNWFMNQRAKKKRLGNHVPSRQKVAKYLNRPKTTGSCKKICSGKRIIYSKSQLDVLETEFQKCQYPNYLVACKLASMIKITHRQVKSWFKRRRTEERRVGQDSQIPSEPTGSVKLECIKQERLEQHGQLQSEPTGLSELEFYLGKKKFTRNQLNELENEFKKWQYPEDHIICQLASTLNLTRTQVKNWFQNRRNKQKKQTEHNREVRRTKFSSRQIAELEREFKKSHYPDRDTICELALRLNLKESQVRKWFGKQRYKLKKSETNDQLINSETQSSCHSSPAESSDRQPRCISSKVIINKSQLAVLQREFEKCQYPSEETRADLAAFLNLKIEQVYKWFMNRRFKYKKQKLQVAVQSPTKSSESSEGHCRAKRITFSKDQLAMLENEFKKGQYPDYHLTCKLASAFNLTYEQVKVWFKNRRSKQKMSESAGELEPLPFTVSVQSPSIIPQAVESLAEASKKAFDSTSWHFPPIINLPVLSDDKQDCFKNLSRDAIQQTSLSFQCYESESYASGKFSSPAQQRSETFPLISEENEHFIGPWPPTARYICSYVGDVQENRLYPEDSDGMAAYERESLEFNMPILNWHQRSYLQLS